MTLVDLGAVTYAGYVARTGDSVTASGTVTGSLVEAERLLGEELRRELALEERTESMIVTADGVMYPKAWPITACDTNVIDGRVLLGGFPDVNQFVAMIGVSSSVTPRASITYTGGFDADTLPITLAHAIYDLAHALTFSTAPVLVGAGSMSVGDVSVSLTEPGDSGVDSYVPGISSRVRKWRNRWL